MRQARSERRSKGRARAISAAPRRTRWRCISKVPTQAVIAGMPMNERPTKPVIKSQSQPSGTRCIGGCLALNGRGGKREPRLLPGLSGSGEPPLVRGAGSASAYSGVSTPPAPRQGLGVIFLVNIFLSETAKPLCRPTPLCNSQTYSQ